MGTEWNITLYAPDQSLGRDAAKAAFERVAQLEKRLTDYDPEGELLQLCRREVGVPHPVSADLYDALEHSKAIWRATEGAFDVTVGPIVQLWRRARRQRELPSEQAIHEALALTGFQYVTLGRQGRTVLLRHAGMRLDLGGIGKGYAADAALDVLRAHGISKALVAASGDLSIGDPPPGERGWRIAVGSGKDPGKAPVPLILHNAGVSTSGDLEQFVEIAGTRYSHIVDPATGIGLTNRIQATIVARSATLSDAWATAVCVLGTDRGLALVERQRRMAVRIVSARTGDPQIFESSKWPRTTHAQ